MIIQGPEIYYAASCLILVVTSLFCALVRYFHMCRPFDEEETYFYPARKLITIIYACFALPVVWLFRMDSPDAYFFMRVFLMLLLPGAGVFLQQDKTPQTDICIVRYHSSCHYTGLLDIRLDWWRYPLPPS